jgi:hypothetical protein
MARNSENAWQIRGAPGFAARALSLPAARRAVEGFGGTHVGYSIILLMIDCALDLLDPLQ